MILMSKKEKLLKLKVLEKSQNRIGVF